MVGCTSEDPPIQGKDTTTPTIVKPDYEKPINNYTDSFEVKFSEIVRYENEKEISVQKTPITVTYKAYKGELIFDRQGSFGAGDIIRRKYWVSPTIGWSFMVEVMDYSGGNPLEGYLLDNDYYPKNYSRWNIGQSKIEVFEMGSDSTKVGEFKDWELR